MPATDFEKDPDFELLPVEDEALTGEEMLDAAELALLEDPFEAEDAELPPIPFGRSWAFDYERERFVRAGGGAPLEVRGEEALREWILAALHTAAGAHPILPASFGFEDPDDFVGSVDPSDALGDFEDRVRDALTEHDRIDDVDEVDWEHDPEEGVVTVPELTVVTDEEESVPLADIVVEAER